MQTRYFYKLDSKTHTMNADKAQAHQDTKHLNQFLDFLRIFAFF